MYSVTSFLLNPVLPITVKLQRKVKIQLVAQRNLLVLTFETYFTSSYMHERQNRARSGYVYLLFPQFLRRVDDLHLMEELPCRNKGLIIKYSKTWPNWFEFKTTTLYYEIISDS